MNNHVAGDPTTPSNSVTSAALTISTTPGAPPASAKLTPLMQQYWSIKSEHSDKIVLFRMGDFYEMFHRDAEIAAPILNIALTSRNKKAADETKMCGVPHHSIAGPIAKLLAAGHKVAICDQIEDPAFAKGIVKRAVTRTLTPGMVYDPDTLDQLTANYICSYDMNYTAFVDVSTGQAFYMQTSTSNQREHFLQLLQPVELVLPSSLADERRSLGFTTTCHLSVFDGPTVEPSAVKLTNHLVEPAHRLLAYIEKNQGRDSLRGLSSFVERKTTGVMEVPTTVLRHLEVFSTYQGQLQGSLFFALQRTKTPAGARLLKSWLQFPLLEKSKILSRQNRITQWMHRPQELKSLRQVLGALGDLERRLGRVTSQTCSASDLLSVADALRTGLLAAEFISSIRQERDGHERGGALNPTTDPRAVDSQVDDADTSGNTATHESIARLISQKIIDSVVDEPPFSVREGGMFREGVHSTLDELIHLSQDTQRILLEFEARERERTQIGSLKVRYNNIFGYSIELTKTHAHKAPPDYLRKQTLANAERFTTEELQQMERKILSAKSRRSDFEYNLFQELRAEVIAVLPDLLLLARTWAELDVLSSLAWLAIERNYTQPTFSPTGRLNLENSRHPVVEQEIERMFVANSFSLESGECLMLTGPNMAGKSTLMRQVAQIAIMAQIGSYVPASRAELPLFSRLSTRIGASDSLAEGLSTFMVEMSETAQILKTADQQTLVIMDEIGRGTSTFDGMSLAQAILEYLVTTSRAMVLFATHYHELTELSQRFQNIKNAHMAIRDSKQGVEFLYTLVAGAANKSYGIQVAKLAGLPARVTQRARTILNKLEAPPATTSAPSQLSLQPWIETHMSEEGGTGEGEGNMDSVRVEATEAPPASDRTGTHLTKAPVLPPFIEELKSVNVQQMTPLEALNRLAKWQQTLL